MVTRVSRVASRPRGFVGVRGPDAAGYLQRMLSNDVQSLEVGSSCQALLLTSKARVIAPLRAWRRGEQDFLLLTEPGLADVLASQLLRSRFAAKAEIAIEEHRSTLVLGDPLPEAVPNDDYSLPACEVLDADPPAGEPVPEDELDLLRIEAGTPVWGLEIDDRVLPAEAGLVERAISLTKGCYPGQEPVARLQYRGHPNRLLRVLELEGAELPPYDAEIRDGERVVGRITSAARDRDGASVVALGYVRREVAEEASLSVAGRTARLRPDAAASG
ncbi:MAG: CAF17-like 4Fe-4S cluster assembly/insertion protein YgfZ [Gaiellaceae bacterium]